MLNRHLCVIIGEVRCQGCLGAHLAWVGSDLTCRRSCRGQASAASSHGGELPEHSRNAGRWRCGWPGCQPGFPRHLNERDRQKQRDRETKEKKWKTVAKRMENYVWQSAKHGWVAELEISTFALQNNPNILWCKKWWALNDVTAFVCSFRVYFVRLPQPWCVIKLTDFSLLLLLLFSCLFSLISGQCCFAQGTETEWWAPT